MDSNQKPKKISEGNIDHIKSKLDNTDAHLKNELFNNLKNSNLKPHKLVKTF